jgi:hypothetical protein
MTEDILFDNIYVGHSIDDARTLASETFVIKKSLEKTIEPEVDEEETDDTPSFKENPVEFLRQKAFTFIDDAKVSPVDAIKTHPETAFVAAGLITTFFGMLGVLFGLIGGSQKPITKVCSGALSSAKMLPLTMFFLQSAKKTDAPSADDAKKPAGPVPVIIEEKKTEPSTATKRK